MKHNCLHLIMNQFSEKKKNEICKMSITKSKPQLKKIRIEGKNKHTNTALKAGLLKLPPWYTYTTSENGGTTGS